MNCHIFFVKNVFRTKHFFYEISAMIVAFVCSFVAFVAWVAWVARVALIMLYWFGATDTLWRWNEWNLKRKCPEVEIFLFCVQFHYSIVDSNPFCHIYGIIIFLHFKFEKFYSPNAFHNFLGDRGWAGVFSQREFIVSKISAHS